MVNCFMQRRTKLYIKQFLTWFRKTRILRYVSLSRARKGVATRNVISGPEFYTLASPQSHRYVLLVFNKVGTWEDREGSCQTHTWAFYL